MHIIGSMIPITQKKTLEYKNEIKKWIFTNSKKLKRLNYFLNKIKYDYFKLKNKKLFKKGIIAHW